MSRIGAFVIDQEEAGNLVYDEDQRMYREANKSFIALDPISGAVVAKANTIEDVKAEIEDLVTVCGMEGIDPAIYQSVIIDKKATNLVRIPYSRTVRLGGK